MKNSPEEKNKFLYAFYVYTIQQNNKKKYLLIEVLFSHFFVFHIMYNICFIIHLKFV